MEIVKYAVYNLTLSLKFSSIFLIVVCWPNVNCKHLAIKLFSIDLFYFVADFCLIGQEWVCKISMGGRLVIRLMILIIDAFVSTMDFSCCCFIYLEKVTHSTKGKVNWNVGLLGTFPLYNKYTYKCKTALHCYGLLFCLKTCHWETQ